MVVAQDFSRANVIWCMCVCVFFRSFYFSVSHLTFYSMMTPTIFLNFKNARNFFFLFFSFLKCEQYELQSFCTQISVDFHFGNCFKKNCVQCASNGLMIVGFREVFALKSVEVNRNDIFE